MVEDGFGKKGNVDEMKRVRRGGGSIVLSSTTTMADPRERCGLEKGVVGKATAVVATGGGNRNSKRRERYSQYWGPCPRRRSTAALARVESPQPNRRK